MSNKLRSQTTVKSKISITYLILAMIGPLMMMSFAIIWRIQAAEQAFEDITAPWMLHLFWVVPFLILLFTVGTYPLIRIKDGSCYMNSLWRSRQFRLGDINAFAQKQEYKRGRTLLLNLQDGSVVKIYSSCYENFWMLRQALTDGVKTGKDLPGGLDA